ncbi:MAG: phenylacetate--CoA ligase [Spirochaetota bacterium]
MEIRYWNKEVETLGRDELEKLKLSRLKETLHWALKTPFYKKRLREAGITSPEDVKSLGELQKIPFTTKDDLREAYPYGLLAVPLHEVIRLHASSGTTGIPTVIYHTKSDIDNWTELSARSMAAAGATQADVFQNMMTYGLFTGGLGLHYGGEELGALVIPAGAGNTKRQFKLMKDFKTTIIHATPSYMLHLYAKMEEEGLSLSELSLKKAFAGAEPHSENIRKKIEKLFGIDVYNSYGLSEMNGPGVAFECIYKDGMHVWEDSFILEVIDPATLKVLNDGSEGELVFTTLRRSATPLLRYRTRDLSSVYKGECKCGRTHRRIGRIKGRTDDMLKINGVNVFPSQIEEVLMKMPEVGTNYQIVVEKSGALDRLTVKTEVTAQVFTDDTRDLNALKGKIHDNLKASIAISPVVELHEPGILPVYEGKAKRVIDIRQEA